MKSREPTRSVLASQRQRVAAGSAAVRGRISDLEAAARSQAMQRYGTRPLVSALLILLVAALLVPALRESLELQQVTSSLQAELALITAESERLDHELERWEDPAFVEATARSRLGFVRPGDKVWRTIGGEMLAEDVDPATGVRVGSGVVGATAGQPWYDALMESIQVAGGPVPDAEDDLDAILNGNN